MFCKPFCILFLFINLQYALATGSRELAYLGGCQGLITDSEGFNFGEFKTNLRIAFEQRNLHLVQAMLFRRLRGTAANPDYRQLSLSLFEYQQHANYVQSEGISIPRRLRTELSWSYVEGLLNKLQESLENGPQGMYTQVPADQPQGEPWSDSETLLTVDHGGGFWFLQEFLAGLNVGYGIRWGGGQRIVGIGVHPVHGSGRTEYYAMRGAELYFDHPATLELQIPANRLLRATNRYEAVLTYENLRYARNIRLRSLDTGIVYQLDQINGNGTWDVSQTEARREDERRYLYLRGERIDSLMDRFGRLDNTRREQYIRTYTESPQYQSLANPLRAEDGEVFLREVVWHNRYLLRP